MQINLELEKAADSINKKGAKNVCIQLPDGLKPRAKEILEFLSEKTEASIFIWAGSCYGACDYPDLDRLGIDLLIQWGHSRWIF